jgi:hypothetical protein
MSLPERRIPKDAGGPDRMLSVISQPTESIVEPVKYPRSLVSLASHIRGDRGLTAEHHGRIKHITETDWSNVRLDMSVEDHRDYAAWGVAMGAGLVHGFGNFYAVTLHPDLDAMRSVNVAKGRPENQVASVFTSKDKIEGLDANGNHEIFDMTRLPEGMTPEQTVVMMRTFFQMGPFGFRGANALEGYPHLTSSVTGSDGAEFSTIQIIAPGYRDIQSNDLARRTMEYADVPVLAITSANKSHTMTGTKEEPAHWKIRGIQDDFGNGEFPFIMLGHNDEDTATAQYTEHDPMSTSVIGFHRDLPMIDGRPTVSLERHGSLPVRKIVEVLDELGINLVVTKAGAKRLGKREYPEDKLLNKFRENHRSRKATHTEIPVFSR